MGIIRGTHTSPGIYTQITDIIINSKKQPTSRIGTIGYNTNKNKNNNSGGSTPSKPTVKNYLTFTALEDNCAIGLTKLSTNQTLEYSNNQSTWNTFDMSTDISLNSNDKVYIRGKLSADNTDSNNTQFKMSGKVSVSGNCNTLWDYEDLNTPLKQYCGYSMFYNCQSLTTAPELPATTLSESCYNSMFRGCTSLTTAPELPATTLAERCYYSMFNDCALLTTAPILPAKELSDFCYQYMFANCKGLTTAPELPATTLSTYCYQYMFANCKGLITAPELPATTLTEKCYGDMFEGCTSLTHVPDELPATELYERCYEYMFEGCTSLTSAPELPATTLAERCYSYMFANCTGLTKAPELPATTLAEYCYNSMFQGCTSLTKAPELPATTLADFCYYSMFFKCTSLNYIKCLSTDVFAIGSTQSWVTMVSSMGTFVKHPDMNNWSTGINGIPEGWVVKDMDIPYVTFTAKEDNSSIGLEKLSTNQSLWYSDSSDFATSHDFDTSTNISLNSGDKVYIRGKLSADNTEFNYTQFKMSGKISASGNCNAIWDYEDLSAPLQQYCGYCMFQNCSSLITAPKLPATVLTEGCYRMMFQNCTNLTEIHELLATTLAYRCYEHMFQNCQSLTKAAELPATVLTSRCYFGMFAGCVSLNYIKCLATDITASESTYYWVEAVSSTGRFVKHPDATWSIGNNGTPTGWTVEDAVL